MDANRFDGHRRETIFRRSFRLAMLLEIFSTNTFPTVYLANMVSCVPATILLRNDHSRVSRRKLYLSCVRNLRFGEENMSLMQTNAVVFIYAFTRLKGIGVDLESERNGVYFGSQLSHIRHNTFCSVDNSIPTVRVYITFEQMIFQNS